jgi:carbonic anhydrase
MSKVVDQVLAANEAYARDFGARSELALPPARRFAIHAPARVGASAGFY